MSLPKPYYRNENGVLYNGDCFDILPYLNPADLVLTDPPYGIGLIRKTNDYRQSKNFDNGKSLQASQLYFDDYEYVRNLIKNIMPKLLAMCERAVIFPGPKNMFVYPEPACIGAVFTPNGAGRCSWGFQCSHPILFYGKDPFLSDGKGGRPNGFRTEQPNNEKIDHPCPKPISWIIWAVNRASRENEFVLDPFMGSGTTAIACERLNRKWIGVEISEKYCEIAAKRIEKERTQLKLFPQFEQEQPKMKQASIF